MLWLSDVLSWEEVLKFPQSPVCDAKCAFPAHTTRLRFAETFRHLKAQLGTGWASWKPPGELGSNSGPGHLEQPADTGYTETQLWAILDHKRTSIIVFSIKILLKSITSQQKTVYWSWRRHVSFNGPDLSQCKLISLLWIRQSPGDVHEDLPLYHQVRFTANS